MIVERLAQDAFSVRPYDRSELPRLFVDLEGETAKTINELFALESRAERDLGRLDPFTRSQAEKAMQEMAVQEWMIRVLEHYGVVPVGAFSVMINDSSSESPVFWNYGQEGPAREPKGWVEIQKEDTKLH